MTGKDCVQGLKENNKISTFLFYNGEILAECNGDSMPIRRHLAGQGLSHVQNLENDTFHAYHQDEQGSTAYVTGTTGETENLYSYDGFGNILESREDITNRILYTGQQYDQETGQYYLRARYYNPVIGRFTQEDTYRGDGLNLYAYCGNNPVMYYDPSGHQTCKENSSSELEDTNANTAANKKLSEMSDAELGELGYKRHSDGSIRDSQGHFAGNSGTNPGTPGVDRAQNYLTNDCDVKYEYVDREISVRSSDGEHLRRYDIVVKDPAGNYIGVEVKSGSATRTQQQVAIDNDLIKSGGLNAVGQKATKSGVGKISDVMLVHVDANGNVQIIK